MKVLIALALLGVAVPAQAQESDFQFRWKMMGVGAEDAPGGENPGGGGVTDPEDPGDGVTDPEDPEDQEPVDEDGDGMPRPFDPDDDDDGIPDDPALRNQVYLIDWMASDPWESMWQDFDAAAGEYELRGARLRGGVPGTNAFVLGDTISFCFGVDGVTAPEEFAEVGGQTSEPGPYWIGSVQITGWHWIREAGMNGNPMVSPGAVDNGTYLFSGRDNSMCFSMRTGLNRADGGGFGPGYGQYTINVETFKEAPPGGSCQSWDYFPPHTPSSWEGLCLQQTGATGRSSVVGITSPNLPGPWN